MRYRLLGNSGLRVSEAALGTMTFGDECASFDLSLSTEQVQALDEASQIDLGFPYSLYGKELSPLLRQDAAT